MLELVPQSSPDRGEVLLRCSVCTCQTVCIPNPALANPSNHLDVVDIRSDS